MGVFIASRHRSRIFVEVLIKQTKRPTVNTKFCEFDGRDGGGRGVFESEGVAVYCLCVIILAIAICC